MAIIVYVICADLAEAEALSTALVEARLVACANIMTPHQSYYWWEDGVQSAEEVAVLFKTQPGLFDAVKDKIVSLHSYDCPCVVSWPIEKGHAPFLDWIQAETKIAVL